MFPIFNKFKKKTKSLDRFVSYIRETSKLSDEINKKSKTLALKEYESILEDIDETFVSLKDFLELMNTENLSIKDILSVCKHISELDKTKFSYIDVYPISIDSDKIILSTKEDPSYSGDKIRIVTVRIKK